MAGDWLDWRSEGGRMNTITERATKHHSRRYSAPILRPALKRWASAAVLLGLALLSIAAPAAAQDADGNPLYYHAPILDPKTGSYYELRQAANDAQWVYFENEALNLSYKGRRGRLAVIRFPETHQLIMKTFYQQLYSREVWIGLRFECRSRQLLWEDGTLYRPGEFSPWATPWYRSADTTCDSSQTMEYMPIAYTSAAEGFRWRAAGPSKVFDWYLVEYPAPASASAN